MTGAVTNHAWDRALERVALAGISPAAVVDRAAKAARYVPDPSAALLMLRLPEKVGDTHGNFHGRDSNGDDLWAIVRRDDFGRPRLTTFFWRRSEQPATPEKFNVAKVYRMKGAAA